MADTVTWDSATGSWDEQTRIWDIDVEVPVEPPRVPYWGPSGGIYPEKAIKKAVKELLAREEAARAEKRIVEGPRELAGALAAKIAEIAPEGLGKPGMRGLLGLIEQGLIDLWPVHFAPETIYDKEPFEKAVLFIASQALERVRQAEEEADEEAVAMLLLSAA